MKNTVFLLPTLLLLITITPCVAATVPSYTNVRQGYISLLGSPQAQRQRHNWLKVIDNLEKFYAESQDAARKDDALFLLGRTWQGLSRASGSHRDAKQALKIYERLAARFPESNLADDALIFAAGIALDTFLDQTSAYNYYLQITSVLPPGDMLGEANTHLRRLAKHISVVPPVENKSSQVEATQQGRISSVRVWNSPEYTRVVLDLSQPVKFEPHQLKGDDPRIYIDFDGVKLDPTVIATQQVQESVVRQVRSSQLEKQRVRVVLDLQKNVDYQVFSLKKPDRVVIDVRRGAKAENPSVEIKAAPESGTDSIAGILDDVPTSSPQKLHVPQHNSKGGITLIVVDAGHGGKDPGAIGPNNTREKDVTLQIAKKLVVSLRKELNCKVLLTRSDDRYLTLHARTAYANHVGADLFISLHANASPNRDAYGLETYYLNLSKNNQAAEVAARENGTTLEEVGNLEAILFDLMANAKINESSRLAAEIQQSLVKNLSPDFSRIKDLGVRQGPFHVLLGATMPSVLVETAFLSNRREEKRLKTRVYQQRVAEAIVKGIKEYRETLSQMARR